MKESMKKYRIFLVCGAAWSAFFFVFNVLLVWAQLWSGDGVQASSIAGAIAHMAVLCYVLLIHDEVILVLAAHSAKKKFDYAQMAAEASLEVALQRLDRNQVSQGDIDALDRTTIAMTTACAGYVSAVNRLSKA